MFKTLFRILLGAFLTFAGTGHLTWLRREFLAQVPLWLPLDVDFVVLTSGVVEIFLGLALIFLTRKKQVVGLATAIFFFLIFPGNISQYMNSIDAFGLTSDRARFIRLFFQPVLIYWAFWSTDALKLLRKGKS